MGKGFRNGTQGQCGNVILPVVELASHSSSDGLAFWAATGGDAIIAQWGSSFESRPAGRVLMRVSPSSGQATRFASGFAHPIAVLVDPRDGGLWVADFGPASGAGPGVLYKLWASR